MTISTVENNTTISSKQREDLLKAFPKGCVAIDLETTGLSPLCDRIIELSAIKVTPSETTTFDQLIDPEKVIPQFTIDIHGITNDMIVGKPKIEEVLPKFLEFAGKLPWIAHNAKFDAGFMVFNIHQLNLDSYMSDVYCSINFARYTMKEMTSYKLANLVKELDIPLENHHRALDDAIACLKVFIAGVSRLLETYDVPKIKKGYVCNMADFSKKKTLDIPYNLRGLKQACEEQELIEIRYRGGSHKGKFRPVKAMSLLPMPSGNVLYAHCMLSDLYKSFTLKKIAEFKPVTKEQVLIRVSQLTDDENE